MVQYVCVSNQLLACEDQTAEIVGGPGDLARRVFRLPGIAANEMWLAHRVASHSFVKTRHQEETQISFPFFPPTSVLLATNPCKVN